MKINFGLILKDYQQEYFGFKKIYLCGFSFEKTGGTIEKLSQIIDNKHFNKLYVISNTFKHDMINSIKKEDFYGHTETKTTT